MPPQTVWSGLRMNGKSFRREQIRSSLQIVIVLCLSLCSSSTFYTIHLRLRFCIVLTSFHGFDLFTQPVWLGVTTNQNSGKHSTRPVVRSSLQIPPFQCGRVVICTPLRSTLHDHCRLTYSCLSACMMQTWNSERQQSPFMIQSRKHVDHAPATVWSWTHGATNNVDSIIS